MRLARVAANMSHRKVVGLAITFALVILLVFFSRDYFTPWLAVLWGMIAIVAVLTRDEAISWWDFRVNRLRLARPLQFALAMILVLGTALATNWPQFGIRDEIQWGYAGWTILAAFLGGLQWAWQQLRSLMLG